MIQELEFHAQVQVENIVTVMADTWNRHDIGGYAALFRENADFINVLGMHWRGRPEIEAVHKKLHETIFRDTQLREQDWSMRFLRSDVALVNILWEMSGARGTASWKVPEVRHGRVSMVLVQSPDSQYGWQITSLQNTEVTPLSMSELDEK